jgi:hypothetical protein
VGSASRATSHTPNSRLHRRLSSPGSAHGDDLNALVRLVCVTRMGDGHTHGGCGGCGSGFVMQGMCVRYIPLQTCMETC